MNSRIISILIPVALLLATAVHSPADAAVPEWYAHYDSGLKAMERGNWQTAAEEFTRAIAIKSEDTKKIRVYGTAFAQYYPNRELGICYYNMGLTDKAREALSRSTMQSSSDRAEEYLNRIGGGVPPPVVSSTTQSEYRDTQKLHPSGSVEEIIPQEGQTIGERLSIAVLPFESKGLGQEIGEVDLLDKLITGFVAIKRFKVIERAQLEKILDEQKLGLTGIIDASTAVEIGKGIGVDAVLLGSVTQAGQSVSVDARLIDTETAAIVTARDAYCSRINLKNISQMIMELAGKFKSDLPILHGYVIGVDGTTLTVDIGRNRGVKKGMKAHVYREGEQIVHPVSGKVIGKEINQICEIQITDVFDTYSRAKRTGTKGGLPNKLDKIVTK
jgi:TolB-like protein